MNSLMYNKIWTLIKVFPTFTTYIWFLSCVNSLMYNQVWASTESFSTFLTFIGFLYIINFLMLFLTFVWSSDHRLHICGIFLLQKGFFLFPYVHGLSLLQSFFGGSHSLPWYLSLGMRDVSLYHLRSLPNTSITCPQDHRFQITHIPGRSVFGIFLIQFLLNLFFWNFHLWLPIFYFFPGFRIWNDKQAIL